MSSISGGRLQQPASKDVQGRADKEIVVKEGKKGDCDETSAFSSSGGMSCRLVGWCRFDWMGKNVTFEEEHKFWDRFSGWCTLR